MIVVALTTVHRIAAVAPNRTAVAPVRLVPVIVRLVPPSVVPVVNDSPVTVGGAGGVVYV